MLYLVRHGEAGEASDDHSRPLTKRGREAIEWMAAWAPQAGVTPDQIRHSGLRRAEETATILGERIKPARGVISVKGLAPGDDVRPMVKALHKEKGAVMLVGHLPYMGRLAGALLADDPERDLVRFKKGAMACLVREGDVWELAWLITPEQIV